MTSPALPPDVLQELAAAGVTHEVPARTVLFKQGDPADVTLVIQDGAVQLAYDDGQPAKPLGPGSVLDEVALVTDRGRRSATAVTVTPCRVSVIDRRHFDELVRTRPELAWRALRHACDWLVGTSQDLVADLRKRNRELEQALDFLRRTRDALDATQIAAQTDALTALYNRRCLDLHLPAFMTRALAEGSGLAILLLDLDMFKPINDTHGHAAGDLVLAHVGAVLREHARATDLPCRIGGDEFAVVLAPTVETEAAAAALRLRDAIAAIEIQLPEAVVRVGATIGGTSLGHGDDAASLIARADRHLYQAKEAGRNRVSWEGVILEGEAALHASAALTGIRPETRLRAP